MKVSIVTCTFNRAEQLKRGIKTILQQTDLPKDLELVIVDDGSHDNDDTARAVGELEKWQLIRGIETCSIYLNHPEPRISCIPRNVGIKNATGDVIIFTEPEGLHVGNTISELLKKMEENPESVILASQVWTMGQRVYKQLDDFYFANPKEILQHPYAQLTDDVNRQNTKAPDSDFGITGENNCNAGVLFAVKKDWLLAIGGFDESFEGFAWDDFDLFNRLGHTGHPLLKCNDIAIIHQWHPKNYGYNIYEAGDKNGKKSEANIKAGNYVANKGKQWGGNK
jgi:glycosyltransferase involved in cell wall biosynthesis